MGVVIPFPRKIAASLPLEELALLDRLCGSFQVIWRDGWAARGTPRGVVLLKGGHCLGAWSHDERGFTSGRWEQASPWFRCGPSKRLTSTRSFC